MKAKLLALFLLCCFFAASLLAQRSGEETVQSDKRVYLEHADTWSYNKAQDVERQTLVGHVLFRQDSVYMSCDTAYFYQSRNSFDAFSNVHMWEGDTLEMWCDSLSYNGDSLVGWLFDNVKMRHNETELHTDHMIYRRLEGEAHYPYSGWIDDPANHLKSQFGWYYTRTRIAHFVENVVMRSYDFSEMPEAARPARPNPDETILYKPKAILYSDTLFYDFVTKDAELYGPSRIENDSNTLYTTLGTMNTDSQQSWLYQHSYGVSPGRYAAADTMFYDGLLGYGDAWGHFLAHDSIQKIRVMGERAHYVDFPQVLTVTDKALAMEFSNTDTLWLHADTIKAYTFLNELTVKVPGDSLCLYDTLQTQHQILEKDSLGQDTLMAVLVDSVLMRMVPQWVDSVYTDTTNYLCCYYNVRYFRRDLQGVCDSLNYNRRDSLAVFVGSPVMWNEHYQITGDTIFTYMSPTNSLDRALVHDQAFLVQQHDSIHYDQISGKELIAYFSGGQIRQMDMSGNVQIIFYPEEGKEAEEKAMVGLLQTIGNYLTIWFQNQKMDHLKVWPQPVGSLTPMPLITDDILYLDGFRWMEYLRPKDSKDVFRDVRIKEEDKVESLRLFNDDELNGY